MEQQDNQKNISNRKKQYMVWFFGGGETRDDRFNIFTGTFIRLMKEIMGDDFDFIRGIYYNSNILNVIWTLNNCQKPLIDPYRNRFINSAVGQIFSNGYHPDIQLVLVASSSGSIIAAQTACYLSELNRENHFFNKPIHLGLGSCVISKESDLFKKLLEYQKRGSIGTFVFDDLHDEDDNARGTGGTTRGEAYSNAFGLMFPFFSKKFSGPSFLNTHPEKGHVHRKRSKTIQKALDYINVLLIKNRLAGEEYLVKVKEVVSIESLSNPAK
ncbi:MAG: hypothetical protein NTW82_13375 [Bacteroidia bacterium]|nr:hypothetical protein [Bacteroidia bacterium]